MSMLTFTVAVARGGLGPAGTELTWPSCRWTTRSDRACVVSPWALVLCAWLATPRCTGDLDAGCCCLPAGGALVLAGGVGRHAAFSCRRRARRSPCATAYRRQLAYVPPDPPPECCSVGGWANAGSVPHAERHAEKAGERRADGPGRVSMLVALIVFKIVQDDT